MNLSDSLKRKFIKDLNLPIPLVEEPYFSYFLNLYDNYFQTKNKYSVFSDFISRVGESEFFNQSKTLIDSVISYFNESPYYLDFNNSELTVDQKNKIDFISKLFSRKEFFKRDLVGENYISIDMKKANFQTLKFFNSNIVKNETKYEDFLKHFTDEKYFFLSKQIRQVIFGNLNPKKISTYQKLIICNIVSDILDLGVKSKDLLVLSNDEIILSNEFNQYTKIIDQYVLNSNFSLHFENFVLNQVHPNFSYFSKDFEDGSFVLKCVPTQNFAEVFKYKTKQSIDNDFDLVFSNDGRICHFDKKLF